MTRQTTQLSLDAMRQRILKSKADAANAGPGRSTGPGPVKPRGSNAASETTDDSQNSTQTEEATTRTTRGAPKNLPKICTVKEGCECLEAAQLIEPEDMLDIDMLAGALAQLSLFPGMSWAVRDAVRAVAFLLAQATLVNADEASTERIVDHVVDRLMDVVKTATQAAIVEIKQASTVLSESSTQIAATATSYRDALKNTVAGPTAPTTPIDARVRVREGIKARQVLVDALTPSQQLHPSANNSQLVARANEALHGTGSPPPHRFVGTRRLNNGGILLETDSEEAAAWLDSPGNKASFLNQFAPDAALKPRTYSLVIQFVPLHFQPDNDSDLRDIETVNQLPSNAILRARWIKPAYWRALDQTCSHVLTVMTRPEDANMILTNGLVICQKRVYTEKCKKEPTRCLKCHGWGHMSYDCQQPFSVCGTCAGCHRTPDCNNRDRTHCVSCGVEGHASWD